MKIKLMSISTLGVAGLVSAGLLALPVTSTSAAGSAELLKRDDSAPELVLVSDDDDDDDTADRDRTRDNTNNTRDNTNNTKDSQTNSRTGKASGRDNSRAKSGKDWTQDGPGATKRDWSVNQTNDRSRNNTSR